MKKNRDISAIVEERVQERVKEYETFINTEMAKLQKEVQKLRKMMEEEQKPRLPDPPKIVTKEIKDIFKEAGKKTRVRT